MAAAFNILLLTSALVMVCGQRYSRGEVAKKKCESYGKMCPYNKVCVIQHLEFPHKMSIPVCVFKVLKPVNSESCRLPPKHGRCGLRLQRWYFNLHSGECSWFHYSGCGGNRNRFMSKASCENFCRSRNSALQIAPDESQPIPLSTFKDTNNPNNNIYLERYNDIESNWNGDEAQSNITSQMMAKLANNVVLTVTTNPRDTLKPLSWYKKRPCAKWKQHKRLCSRKKRKFRSQKKQRRNRVIFLQKGQQIPIYGPPPKLTNSSHRGLYRYLPNRANGHRLFSILNRPTQLKGRQLVSKGGSR
ncbi:uncharacterized protein LOC115209515 [Argonauta hians]